MSAAPAELSARRGGRTDDALPAAHMELAGRYMQSMQNYPTAYTTADDVATAAYTAATSHDNKLRYPAGADSVMLADLRRSLPEQEFMDRMRIMTGGRSLSI